jgi:glycosyltransferase involved in cell wall biosynthesis
MAAALADSEFNVLELRSHGYDAPVACPFLFDIDRLIAEGRSGEERRNGAPFTVLFVGRLVASKAQADLVDAFAEFRSGWSASCRLVLVGRAAAPDAAYPSEIRRRVALYGLQDDVLVTGPISDAALQEWYRAADLYVSLSHHEGFGVPLVEAMAHDVPVIAWPAGAVPYTLGNAGELLPDRSPASVAALLLRIANEPGRRTEIITRQREVLDRFRLGRHAPKLINALMAAGAAPPLNEDAQKALASNLSTTVTGHMNGTYSLAVVNRSLALALEQHRAGTTRIVPWENAPTSDLSGVPVEQARQIKELASRSGPPTGPEVVISQHYPIHVPQCRGDAALAMVFWEESLLPEATVMELNRGFSGVLAPTDFVAKALIDSGVSVPVSTVGYVPQLQAFHQLALEQHASPRDAHRKFTFLHVSSCFPRKGVDVLLAAFRQAFRGSDPVRLIIKGFPNPHNDAVAQVEQLRTNDPDIPDIMIVNEDLSEEEMLDLYRQADAVVLPTRGEGFNIPAAEAMTAGIPLIITGYGGHLDFCGPSDARFVDFRFAPSKSHLATPGSVWVEPDQADLVDALRQIVGDFIAGRGQAVARIACEQIRQRLDGRAWAERINSAAVAALTAHPPSPLRIAWVSTWRVQCGIAEYSRFLLDQFVKSNPGRIDPPIILCDDRTLLSSDEGMSVRPVWRLVDPQSIERLIQTIAVEDPHVLLIQHQPGLIGWTDLARLLKDRRVHNRISVVTLHSAARLLEVEAEGRAEIIAALSRASRLLVHQVADLNLLKDFGLTANVALFPQGAPPRFAVPVLRSLTPEDAPVVGSYGFFLPGKGLSRLIEAVAQLRKDWPKLRLKLINAEHPVTSSQSEIARCRELAASLGLGDAVEWDTGFHPHHESMRKLATCDLLVLPYDESSESSSAALRSAMASGVPVAVTPIGLFQEADTAVHRLKAVDVASAASGIDCLLRDRAARVSYQRAASVWLEHHGWDTLARRLAGMLLGLRASRHSPADAELAEEPSKC